MARNFFYILSSLMNLCLKLLPLGVFVSMLAGCGGGAAPLSPETVARLNALAPRVQAGDSKACLEADKLLSQAGTYGREEQDIAYLERGAHLGSNDRSSDALECLYKAADAHGSYAAGADPNIAIPHIQRAAALYAYLNSVGWYATQHDYTFNQDIETLQTMMNTKIQNAADHQAAMAQMGAILSSGAANLSNTLSQGQANLAAARSGQITAPLQPSGDTGATLFKTQPTVIAPPSSGGKVPDLTIHLPPGAGMRETYLEAARLERVAAAAEKNPAQRAADLQAAQQNEAAAAALSSNAPTVTH